MVAGIRRVRQGVVKRVRNGQGAVTLVEFQPAAVDREALPVADFLGVVRRYVEEQATAALGREQFARRFVERAADAARGPLGMARDIVEIGIARSEEHTSELQSLMRHQYAVFSLKNNNTTPYIILY